MTITPTPNWTRAMRRAMAAGVKPCKLADGRFRVRSLSCPGVDHFVSLDPTGHVVDCSDCKGWARGGRRNPCWHAAAVGLAIAYLAGDSIVPAQSDAGFINTTHRRDQLWPEAA